MIKGIHQKGIHLMTFMKNNNYLVTCGIRNQSPILIYSVKELTLLLSTYVFNFFLLIIFKYNNISKKIVIHVYDVYLLSSL